MKRLLRALCVFTLAAVTDTTFAGTLTAQWISGAALGKWEVNILLDTEVAPGPVALDVTFHGANGTTLLNLLGFGNPVTSGSEANAPDASDPFYKKAQDSWLDDELQGGQQLGFVAFAQEQRRLRREPQLSSAASF